MTDERGPPQGLETGLRSLLPGSARFRRSTVALLVGVAAFAFVFATILGFFHGPFLVDNTDDEMDATSFEFDETTVFTPDDENYKELTGVVITQRSGTDYSQEAVTVEVNGEQAFDLDPGSGIYLPWNGSEDTISEESTRVVVYGEASDEENAENADDPDQYATLEDGDVIEVVWYEPDGDRMNVLQRYVVGDE